MDHRRSRVQALASKYGLIHKLDPILMQESRGYVDGWCEVLEKYAAIVEACPFDRDVRDVDARTFVGSAFEGVALKDKLHESFNEWPEWATGNAPARKNEVACPGSPTQCAGLGKKSPIPTSRDSGEARCGVLKLSPRDVSVGGRAGPVKTIDCGSNAHTGENVCAVAGCRHGEAFSGSVPEGASQTAVNGRRLYIIDADYEHVREKCHVLLYTRDVSSDATALVLCPYYDYFYIQLTDDVSFDLIKKAVQGYCWFLREKRYPESVPVPPGVHDTRKHVSMLPFQGEPLVVSMELVGGLKSMYGYEPDAQSFVKVTTMSPVVTRDLFNGLSKKYNGESRFDEKTSRVKYFPEMNFFEANTDIVNKFFVQHGVTGCAAIEVSGTALARNEWSTCDSAIVADSVSICHDEAVPFYQPRTMFYDIECLSLDVNTFPTADRCPVIQISYLLASGSETVDKGVLCLRKTPGFEWFEHEAQMLLRFVQLVASFNPDCLTGYNSNSFDLPYIIDRMKVLGLHEWAGGYLSRRLGVVVDYKRTFKKSKQFGTKETVSYVIPGRMLFDQMVVIKDNPMIRLRSYALKAVCAEFLGDDNKEDLRYKDIPVLFESEEGRRKIASYCLQDTVLLKKLDDKRLMGIDAAAQAKVQGITMREVLTRGLVYRIMCKLKQYTERFGFLIRTFTGKQFPSSPTYQGATVISCEAGYYMDPVTVLDFASLYPSLIRSYNLDYTTIALDKAMVERYPERFQTFGNGYSFVKSDVQRGLLPRIEAELAVERKNAKQKMKEAESELEEAVWNAIQGSVKVLMNSIYGLTGSPTASVPCVPIASTITFLGRENLIKSKDFVEANYCRITGRPDDKNAKVIYGDTDSIFILMPGVSSADAILYGQQLDNAIKSELFGHLECLVMEYEKVFNPYIQVTPKRYAGWKMELDPNKGKVSASGLQMVKRDSALLCKRTMQTFFDFLLVEKNPKTAEDSVRAMIADLFAGELSVEDFAITKKVSKKASEYKVVPPHIKGWQRMVDRVGTTEAPAVGERFEYIILERAKHEKMCDAIVDTDLVREKGLSKFMVDKRHYHNLYIVNPMKVVMSLVYGEERAKSVLDPENYQHIETIEAKSGKGGNILGFFGKSSVTRKRRWKGLGVDQNFVQRLRQARINITPTSKSEWDEGARE